MNELNPCPFCGKIPNAEYIEDVMYVICSNNSCGMSCIASVTLKEWNNRPIEDALQARIADLESLLRWRPVSDKPIEAGWYDVKLSVNGVVSDDRKKFVNGLWLSSWSKYIIEWRPIPELESTDE